MKKGTVHFTLSDDAGKLLMQIAQEALLYELDPEKSYKGNNHIPYGVSG